MAITERANQYHTRMFGHTAMSVKWDPEYVEYLDNFAFDEVVNHDDFDETDRFIVILSALIGNKDEGEFRGMIEAAPNFGVTPVMMKEIIYLAEKLYGIGHVFPFLNAINDYIRSKEIPLPLPPQGTVSKDDASTKGCEIKKQLFGEAWRETEYPHSDKMKHLGEWLTRHCYGEVYTRNGLTLKQRELSVFICILAHDGCSGHMKEHLNANLRIGNDKEYMIKAITQAVPFIGYLKALDAAAVLDA